MRRALLDIVAIVSLLVALAAGALYVRGYFAMDLLRVHREDWDVLHNVVPQSVTYLVSAWGRVASESRQDQPLTQTYLQRDFELHWQSGPLPPGGYSAAGFWLGWIVLAATALPAGRTAWWVWRRWRGRKTRDEMHPPPGAYGRHKAWFAAVLARVAWLAALVAIAVAVLWVRSYPYFERVDWKLWSGRAGVQLNSSMGSLMLAWTNKGPDRMIARRDFAFIRTCKPPTRGPLDQAADLAGPYVHAAGFTLGTDASTPWPYNVLIVPYWFVEAILLGMSLLTWRYVGRQSNRAEGRLCSRCGYDLRATPDRCPECGLEAAPSA